MGAKLSLEHDPTQLGALRQAEATWLEACGGAGLAREVWVDLPDDPKLAGVTKIRTFQMGPDDPKLPLILFIHGGGGIALEFADLFSHLKDERARFWFMERPGHGCSEPYDYFQVQDSVHEHTTVVVESLRKAAGTQTMHIVANSAGGWCAYWYATAHPESIETLTFLGCPACFQNQPLPTLFYLLGSWLGTQIMARPPPRSTAADLVYNFHKQEPTDVPDCYVDLYLAFMSLRNTSLSWNSWLRCVIWDQKRYFWELKTLQEKVASGVDCHAILGGNEVGYIILPEQVKILEEQMGRPATMVEKGGHLPWHGHQAFVVEQLVKIWNQA